MDASELQALQEPVKSAYLVDPSAALVTLRAEGELGSEQVSCSVDVGHRMVAAGLHPASGGTGSLACSGDMLLQALVACAGVTLRSVAVNRGLDVAGTVTAEGVLDFRGTLGVERDVPVGFLSVALSFALSTTATEDEVSALIRTTERYCVVYQTIRAGTEVSVTTTTSAA